MTFKGKRGGNFLTRKLWFQVGIGILISLFIIKYFIEIHWIFSPILIVAQSIFLPLLLGGVLFYITEPIQRFLEKRKVPRWTSILIIFLLIIALIWVAISIVGPSITKQVSNLIENAPAIIQETNNLIIELLEEVGNISDLPVWVQDAIDQATNMLTSLTTQLGFWAVSIFQSVVQGTLILVITPFFLFFMLKDHEKFAPFILQFFSGNTKIWLAKTLSDIDKVLSLYIRGQILISSILASLLFTGYYFIGLNFALLLSVFAFFMNVIPYIGPWVAFIPALLIAYFQDPIMVIWVSLITLVAQQTDANLITPNIMGKTLKIHPLTIITVLFTAGNIAGFLGILLSIPAYAVGKTIVSNIYEKRAIIRDTANKTV